jgi:hypothetical protein
MKKKFLSFTLCILTIFIVNCGFGTEYGVKTIISPKGEKFYFRRVVRGRNYDTLALSANSNYCAEPDPATAVIFHGLGPIFVFYRFEGDELHIYDSGRVDSPPNFSPKTKVVLHKISNPQFIEMRETYAAKGFEISEVPIDKTLLCLF